MINPIDDKRRPAVGKAAKSTDQRGAFRYELDSAVNGRVGEEPFEGRLKDVSVTGAAVVGLGDAGYDNDQFVNLHMEGIGHRNGYVRRRIPDGFALEFDKPSDDEEERKKLEAVAKLRALGSSGRYG